MTFLIVLDITFDVHVVEDIDIDVDDYIVGRIEKDTYEEALQQLEKIKKNIISKYQYTPNYNEINSIKLIKIEDVDNYSE